MHLRRVGPNSYLASNNRLPLAVCLYLWANNLWYDHWQRFICQEGNHVSLGSNRSQAREYLDA